MAELDSLVLGIPLIVIVPALVEAMKAVGLPARFAGLAAIVAAGGLTALVDLARRGDGAGSAAGYALAGIVYGLGAAGLYSQVQKWREERDLGR